MNKLLQVHHLPMGREGYDAGDIIKPLFGDNVPWLVAVKGMAVNPFWQAQHLYGVVDEPIKQGDKVFYLDLSGNISGNLQIVHSILSTNGYIRTDWTPKTTELYMPPKRFIKVICCTDKKLGLPIIPQSLKQRYADSNGVDNEFEIEIICANGDFNEDGKRYIPKLINNEIVVVEKKEWNQEHADMMTNYNVDSLIKVLAEQDQPTSEPLMSAEEWFQETKPKDKVGGDYAINVLMQEYAEYYHCHMNKAEAVGFAKKAWLDGANDGSPYNTFEEWYNIYKSKTE